MEKRMTTDLLEAKQRGPEKAVLEQVEEYQQEVLKERYQKKKIHNYELQSLDINNSPQKNLQ